MPESPGRWCLPELHPQYYIDPSWDPQLPTSSRPPYSDSVLPPAAQGVSVSRGGGLLIGFRGAQVVRGKVD